MSDVFKDNVVVGNYVIGSDCVELALRSGDGGEFYFIPAIGATPKIVIGADQDHYGLLGTFIHEVLEYSMTRNRLRWLMTEDQSNDHSGYTFIMTHPEFSDCCNKLADGLLGAQKDLKKAWKKWHKDLKMSKKVVDSTETI